MRKWVCSICGYIHEGDTPPTACPQCKAPASKFTELASANDGAPEFVDAHKVGVAIGVEQEVIDGLRMNFAGECTEVGMYLAMSRQAEREGYIEVAEAYKRIAFEEADHAAKFAELLGEVVWADTKTNLQRRLEVVADAHEADVEIADAQRAQHALVHAVADLRARDPGQNGAHPLLQLVDDHDLVAQL